MLLLDPVVMAKALKLEADRLKAEYEDAAEWTERQHATPALQAVANDQRDAALAAYWLHTEELAPLVVRHLNRKLQASVEVLIATMPRARDWNR